MKTALALLFCVTLAGMADEAITTRSLVIARDRKVRVDTVPKAGDRVIPFSESPLRSTWRLVHDGTHAIAFFESAGRTWTTNALVCGTSNECQTVVAKLKLEPAKEMLILEKK